jgi:DNA replication and repair protein RecF
VLVTGANGAGKTNLLEAVHLATQGLSFRTRHDAQIVRNGTPGARVTARGRRGAVELRVEVSLSRDAPKRIRLDGATVGSAEELRRKVHALVFTPDRLAVVKGGPAARRAYFDRTIGRLFPARAGVPQDYAAALAQRNAALRRVQLGLSDRAALEPWTERIAGLGASLVEARRAALERLSPSFAERAEELGLADARLGYDADPPTAAALEARLQRDVERGATGLGPHLDDVTIGSGGRDLRQFGSQGEQRLAVLSLLLAEAELLETPPLLLLDDVLSELDPGRRRVLAERVATMGQTMITATHASALPVEPSQLVEVEAGTARS